MTKIEWLMRLRRISNRATLEKVIERKAYEELEADERAAFVAAADHRLAELIMGQLFDKVPKSAWTWVK